LAVEENAIEKGIYFIYIISFLPINTKDKFPKEKLITQHSFNDNKVIDIVARYECLEAASPLKCVKEKFDPRSNNFLGFTATQLKDEVFIKEPLFNGKKDLLQTNSQNISKLLYFLALYKSRITDEKYVEANIISP
tara:strand:- start:44 stop:451 length:408 start_codon:yes stop_codon:yes gene_type:complete